MLALKVVKVIMGSKLEEKLAFDICCKYVNLNKTNFLDIELTEEPDIQKS